MMPERREAIGGSLLGRINIQGRARVLVKLALLLREPAKERHPRRLQPFVIIAGAYARTDSHGDRDARVEKRESKTVNGEPNHESPITTPESQLTIYRLCATPICEWGRFGSTARFAVDEAGESLVRAARGQMNLSARGYHRVPKKVVLCCSILKNRWH